MLLCNRRIFFKFEHHINYCGSAPNAVLRYWNINIASICMDASILPVNFLVISVFDSAFFRVKLFSFQRLNMGSIRLGLDQGISQSISPCVMIFSWTVKWVFGRSSDLGPYDWFDWSPGPSFTSTDSQTELETVLQVGRPCSARVDVRPTPSLTIKDCRKVEMSSRYGSSPPCWYKCLHDVLSLCQ